MPRTSAKKTRRVSFAADEPVHGPLPSRDLLALRRLLRRTLGRGFQLVVIEVEGAARRERVVAWLEEFGASLDATLVEVDVEALVRENLWRELGEQLPEDPEQRARSILTLHGFEAAEHGQPDARAGLYRQLNVQRDLFVRDLGCVWVVFVHPHGSRQLQDIAPDFCDFASLWVRAPVGEGVMQELSLGAGAAPSLSFGGVSDNELLARANAALVRGDYAGARDSLARYEISCDASDRNHGWSLSLRSALELAVGQPIAAQETVQSALAWEQTQGTELGEARARRELGRVLAALGRFDEACAELERALTLVDRPVTVERREGLVAAALELGRVLRLQGQLDDAQRRIEEALDTSRGLSDDEQAWVSLEALRERGLIDAGRGELARASEQFERALALARSMFASDDHPQAMGLLRSLGRVRLRQGRFDEARELFEGALASQRRLYGTDAHPDVAVSLQNLAAVAARTGQLTEAREQLERAVAILTRAYGSDDNLELCGALNELATVLRAQGDHAGARPLYQRSLAIMERVYGADGHPALAVALYNLGKLLREQGEPQDAIPMLRRALEIERRVHSNRDDPYTALTEAQLALSLIADDQDREGLTLLGHALVVFDAEPESVEFGPRFRSLASDLILDKAIELAWRAARGATLDDEQQRRLDVALDGLATLDASWAFAATYLRALANGEQPPEPPANLPEEVQNFIDGIREAGRDPKPS